MDRISGLSDELLIKILLLVPTKVAVSTSILSKRWEYLWMWLPRLEYGTRYCSESEWEKLRCFLDKTLPLHRAPVIESFRLELSRSCLKPKNMNTWVLTAVSHCLREMEIVDKSCPTKPNTLPSNLFACKSLVILRLCGSILLDVPRMVSLPSLKTLKLQWVRYFSFETLHRLLLNCPILEDLVVVLNDHGTKEKLTLVVPSLQSLTLYISSQLDIDGFVIETPNLKYFDLWDKNGKEHYCLIENMPNLIVAKVVFHCPDINCVIGSITSVKRLSICSQAMFDEGFVFNQLEHLDLCLSAPLFPDQLFRLLGASSKLKRLDISFLDCHDTNPMEDWNEPSTVPECMLSSLQTLNWSFYSGLSHERDIVIYILRHALHLKSATIKSFEDDVPKYEMLQELSLSSRASAACQLMFECATED